MIKSRAWVVGAFVILLASGCGRPLANISGTVKFKGQPLPAGTITFYDQDHGAISSKIEPNGTYSVSKVRAGSVKVAVAVPMPISFDSPIRGGGRANLPVPAARVPSLPPHYLDPENSGLTFEVIAGDQTHDFDLKP